MGGVLAGEGGRLKGGRVGQRLNATSFRPPGDLGNLGVPRGNIAEVSARIPFSISVAIDKRIPANRSHCRDTTTSARLCIRRLFSRAESIPQV